MISFPSTQRLVFGATVLFPMFALAPPVALAANKVKVASVADYAKCVDHDDVDPQLCLDGLRDFVKAHPEQAFAAGKAVRASANHAAAIPFFATALSSKASAKRDPKVLCADPDVAMALISGLSLPGGDGSVAAVAQGILFKTCWNETHDAVLKALTEAGGSGYLASNLCPTLAEKKQANAACQTKPATPPAPAASQWKDVERKGLRAEGPAKTFKGTEGRIVTLVKLSGQGEAYLLRFDGFRGEWNGRTILHRAVPAGSGYNYVTQAGGGSWTGFVVRDGVHEAYPLGDKGPFEVWYDDSLSKATNPQAVVDQFMKQPR